jgi:hypothetical protein
VSCLIAKWGHGEFRHPKCIVRRLGKGRRPMSHKDKARSSPIGAEDECQNTNENCVPRNCRVCFDGRNETMCDQGARFMHSTDIGVPP